MLLPPYFSRFRHVVVAGCVELKRTAIRIFLLIFAEMGLEFEMLSVLDTRGPASSMVSSEVSVLGGGLNERWVDTRVWALQAKQPPLGTKTNGVMFHVSVVV